MLRVLVVLTLVVACGSARHAAAHDGPEHVIEAIDAEIAKRGATAELLYRRACEFRALRQYATAEADLKAALRLDVDFTPARFELARVAAHRGETARAAKLVEPLIASDEDALRAAALALRGELHVLSNAAPRAVEDFTAAIALRPEVEWFLQRADAQQRCVDAPGQLAGLREGLQLTASPVLKAALCEALILAGEEHRNEAQTLIDEELADGRFHSAWLVRRAQLLLAQDRRFDAEADLRAALAELQSRLNPERPDTTLAAEQAVVRRLLGIAPPPTKVDRDD